MLMSEFPVVSVHIPPTLRAYTDGHEEVMASGETVGDILEAVGHTYPQLGEHLLCRDGELVAGLCIYLGGHSLRRRAALVTPVLLEGTLSVVVTGEPDCAIDTGGYARRAVQPAVTLPGGDISIGD